MPAKSSVAGAVPYIFGPSDFQFNDALNADFNQIAGFNNIFTYLTQKQIADVQAGTMATDIGPIINSALTAIGQGVLFFPPGTYGIATTVVINTGQNIIGAGQGVTTFRNMPTAAVAMFHTKNYSSLVNTNTIGGPFQWSIQNCTIDGNRTAVSGTGDCLDVYGYDFLIQNVTFENATGHGIYSQWSTDPTSPVSSGGDGMEAHVYNVKVINCAGIGILWQGPHDSHIDHLLVFNCLNGGLYLEDGANFLAVGTVISNVHCYGFNSGIYINSLDIRGNTIISENNSATGIFIDTAGSLLADGVWVFENGPSQSGLVILGTTSPSLLTNVFAIANTLNGVSLEGNNNKISGLITINNGNVGLSVSGTSNTANGVVSFGNTSAQYQIATGNAVWQDDGWLFTTLTVDSWPGVTVTATGCSYTWAGRTIHLRGTITYTGIPAGNCVFELPVPSTGETCGMLTDPNNGPINGVIITFGASTATLSSASFHSGSAAAQTVLFSMTYDHS